MLDIPAGEVRSALLLWLGRLGDLLVATPFTRALKARHPGARVILVTGERGAAAAPLMPGVDEFRVLRRAHRAADNARLAWELGRGRYDLLVELNSAFSRSSAVLAALARSRVKLAFRKGRWDKVWTHVLPPPMEQEAMTSRYARLAAALGLPYDPSSAVVLTDAERRAGEEALGRLDLPEDRFKVAVFPGNFKKFDNRWPEENFAALAAHLAGRGDAAPFLLAGPGELERVRAVAGMISRSAGAPPAAGRGPLAAVPVAGPYPLGVTAALLERCDLFVGNCTGTSHLAAAVGTPTFTILSRYTRAVWMPPGPRHRAVVSDSWESCREVSVAAACAGLDEALRGLGPR